MPAKREYSLEVGLRLEVTPPRGAPIGCQVLSPLDHGANSHTYLARTDPGEHVALKCSRWCDPGQIDADLRIEAEILPQLSTDAVIRLLGSAKGPQGKLVLAYERAFPNPLLILCRPEIRRHFPDPGTRFVPLPPPLTLQLGCDLLRGIGQMHAQGFVHHDVKLSNLMVRVPETGQVVLDHQVLSHAMAGRARGVLIDVGGSRSLAYLADLDAGRVTPDVQVVPPQLTPLYAPPEALVPGPNGGRPRLLPSLDLYAAAIVIYACATGRLPYEEQRIDPDTWEGIVEAKEAELRGKLSPISFDALRRSPGWGPMAGELFRVLRALTNIDPEQRPRAKDARTHLERLLEAMLGR